ncbi:putative RNA-directed DNA polymerase from transposon BS [Trichonephila clavipes]|nr:putative RNA-directed DNA polymerase from transposon BS [Trichonephila clavipes]
MTSPDEIWILCDSRSAIQHLSDWTNVGDKTSVSILKNLKELSQQHEIYFQWIPSHIGLFGNDTADLLAKEGVTEDLMSRRTLTFSEIFSKTKSLIQELWKTPPTHPWYNRQAQVVPFPSRWIESSKQLLVGLQVDTLEAFPFT